MNIAFDAKRVTRNRTGLGNYSRFIIRSLAEYSPENNYLLASHSVGDLSLYSDLLDYRSVHMIHPNKRKSLSEIIWRNWGLRRQLKEWDIDVYHGLSNELPLGLINGSNRRIATVLTMHDLIFLHHPEYYKRVDRWIYKYKYIKSAQQCNHIIAVSERTKEDLIEFAHIEEEKISVIYQGCSRRFIHIPSSKAEWARSKYKLPDRYMLFVGSIEERKNVDLIVKAMRHIKDKEIALVVVGKKTPYVSLVLSLAKKYSMDKRVYMLHNVGNEDLPGVFKAAELFVYPSKYEGFGIPIIEAMNAGVPVIGATGSCLEEAGGPYSLYTDPEDDEMLGGLINKVIFDNYLKNNMIKNGLNYVRRFSPKEVSQALVDVYGKVMLR